MVVVGFRHGGDVVGFVVHWGDEDVAWRVLKKGFGHDGEFYGQVGFVWTVLCARTNHLSDDVPVGTVGSVSSWEFGYQRSLEKIFKFQLQICSTVVNLVSRGLTFSLSR